MFNLESKIYPKLVTADLLLITDLPICSFFPVVSFTKITTSVFLSLILTVRNFLSTILLLLACTTVGIITGVVGQQMPNFTNVSQMEMCWPANTTNIIVKVDHITPRSRAFDDWAITLMQTDKLLKSCFACLDLNTINSVFESLIFNLFYVSNQNAVYHYYDTNRPDVCCVISIFFSFTLVPICSVFFIPFVHIFHLMLFCEELCISCYTYLNICTMKKST